MGRSGEEVRRDTWHRWYFAAYRHASQRHHRCLDHHGFDRTAVLPFHSVVALSFQLTRQVSIFIGFILPAISYLQIRKSRQWNVRKTASVVLLVGGAIISVLASYEAVGHISDKQCSRS